jgi:lipopolysaccharide transport system permease protein
MFGKVYFPRLIVPFSIVISNLVKFGVQLLLLILLMIYFKIAGASIDFSFRLLIFPLLVILMAAQGLGLGLIVSSLTTKYRDLALLLTFGIQLLMFSTTVVYPLSSVSGNMRTVVALNPMTPVLEGIRFSLFGTGTFDIASLMYATFAAVLLIVTGVLTFNKVEKNFVDTI